MNYSMRGSRSPWLATPLIALATFLGLYGLSTMIEMGPWRLRMVAILALVAGAVIITRLFTRSRVLPTAVGAIVGILVCIPAFARDEDGGVFVFPTPAAFGALGASLRDAVTYAATTVAPAEVTLPFLALLTLGMLVLFLAAEHLAVSWRAAATAGLLLMIPWLPAVILQHRVSGLMIMVAIACWLLTLGLTKRLSVTDRSAAPGPTLAATVAAMALVVVAAPTALGGNGWGMIPRIAAPAEIDTATRLNLALDLRTSLTTGADSPLMMYVSSGDRPDVLRLYALTDFDGAAWDRTDPEPSQRPASGGVLWPTPVDDWAERETDRLNIHILALAETNLPVPAVPRAVDVDRSWTYVSELDEIVTEGNGTQDLQYSTVADFDYFDAAELQAMQGMESVDEEAGVGPEYTTVAPAVDLGRITALSLEVTADATSRYDEALAIQTYLRNPEEFTYDTSVQPQGADTVSTFLDEKSGYCVQFATTMVVMLRSIGVPARLAVGFLPGTRRSDGAYIISGSDAHAWPEVYFTDVGWVRFEPTPSTQTGAVPAHANPQSEEIPVPQSVIDAAQSGQPAPIPSGAPEQGQGRPEVSDAVDESGAVPWAVVVAVLVFGIVLLSVGLWLLMRRRRARIALGEGPDAAWAWLHAQLSPDVTWNLSDTPHEAAEHVEASVARYGVPLPESARDALWSIAIAVSDHRYAPQGTEATEAQLRALAADVVAASRESLDATGRPARGGARSALQA